MSSTVADKLRTLAYLAHSVGNSSRAEALFEAAVISETDQELEGA